MHRRRKRKRDRAGDAAECGCCLADAVGWTLVLGVVVAWRRRRGRRG